MPKFTVTWVETVSQITEIEAETGDAAIELAKQGEFNDLQTEFIEREDDSFSASPAIIS